MAAGPISNSQCFVGREYGTASARVAGSENDAPGGASGAGAAGARVAAAFSSGSRCRPGMIRRANHGIFRRAYATLLTGTVGWHPGHFGLVERSKRSTNVCAIRCAIAIEAIFEAVGRS